MARFSDLDFDFNAHPVTGELSLLEEAEAVKRSVRNLVLLARHEKPFNPTINCGIRQMLFEPLSPITAMHMRQNIINAIKQFEPRAKLLEVQVIAKAVDNAFNVSVYFRIRNTPEPINLDITLERLR